MMEIDKLGVIAGEGNFPIIFSREAKKANVPVIAYAINGLTSSQLANYVDKIYWLNISQISSLIKLFKEEGIKYAVMVGKVPQSIILQYDQFDEISRQILQNLDNKQANSILMRVVEEFAKENITFIDTSLFIKHMLAPTGLITSNRPPSVSEERDIQFGYDLAKVVAGVDIGQTIIVKSQIVVAVEAIEGTDMTILRGGKLGGPGTVVIKVSKPKQDKRFDLPIVGLDTIKTMRSAKASCIAMSAGETLLFDKDECVQLAEESDICIMGL